MSKSNSRTAEKLIILLDYSTGLLTRVYHCVRHQYGPHVACLKKDLINYLSKEVEDPTSGVDVVSGYEVMDKQQAQIKNETQFVYDTMVDVVKVNHECEKLFESLANEIVEFNLHTNTDLTTRFLEVFTNYIKIHLLLERISHARVAAYCHIITYHRVNDGMYPDRVNEVKHLLYRVREPIKYLQSKMGSGRVGESVHEALDSIRSSYMFWTSHEAIKRKNLFHLIAKPELLAERISFAEFTEFYDATHIEKLSNWILCLYIVFPEQLGAKATGPPSESLKLALQDRQIISLYRDEVIDMVQLYSNLQKHSLPTIKVPTLSKLLKLSDPKAMVLNHAEMRNILTHELKSLTQLCETLPGVIPVKLPILIAILALSRNEILWVFQHCRGGAKNKVKRLLEEDKGKDTYVFANLPDLMWHTDHLATMIKVHTRLAVEYYGTCLVQDLAVIEPTINKIKKKGAVDTYVIAHLDYILKTLKQIKNDPNQRQNIEGMRLNWYRASALLSQASGGGRTESEKKDTKELVRKMNQVIEHSRYWDRLDREIDNRSTFFELWFYRTISDDVFTVLLHGQNLQSKYWPVFLRIWSQALRNVHKQNGEEREVIGNLVLKKAQEYLGGAISIIESACGRKNGLIQNYSTLRHQYNPDDILKRIIAQKNVHKRKEEQIPGFESQFSPKADARIKNMFLAKQQLQDAAHAFGQNDWLLIYDMMLYPCAYLYDKLYEYFKRQMRVALEVDKSIVRPTYYLTRLQNLFKCVSDIDAVVSVDLTSMIRQLLYEQMHDPFVGSIGTAVGVPEDTGLKIQNYKKDKLIHKITSVYMHMLGNGRQGKVYSPLYHGFFDVKADTGGSNAEDYFSPSELIALCRIIGPSGVRVMDTDLIKKATKNLEVLKMIFEKNTTLLKKIDMRKFYGIKQWAAVVSKISGLDELVKNSISLGSILLFRKTLRDALKQVMNAEAPFESQSVQLLHERLMNSGLDHKTLTSENQRFNDLALDFGILSDLSDSIFRSIASMKTPQGDPEGHMWRTYSPLMFGVCFVVDSWANHRFHVSLGALSNNGFALAEAVHFICSVFAKDPNERRALKEKYLNIASMTLLYMRDPRMKNKYKDYNIDDMLTYLDYFVSSSDDLPASVLDKVSVSNSVIRAQYVSTYGEMTGMWTEASIVQKDDEDELKEDGEGAENPA